MEHLSAFKKEVEKAFPGRVEQVTLFGSRARGEARDDSDYDIAIFLRDIDDEWRATETVSRVSFQHMLEGVYISPIVLPTGYLENSNSTELAAEIARDGLAVP